MIRQHTPTPGEAPHASPHSTAQGDGDGSTGPLTDLPAQPGTTDEAVKGGGINRIVVTDGTIRGT